MRRWLISLISPGSWPISLAARRFRNRRACRWRIVRLRRGVPLAKTVAAEFAWGHAGICLERAVERTQRREPGIERDGEDRHPRLARIVQRGGGFREAVAIDIAAEI